MLPSVNRVEARERNKGSWLVATNALVSSSPPLLAHLQMQMPKKRDPSFSSHLWLRNGSHETPSAQRDVGRATPGKGISLQIQETGVERATFSTLTALLSCVHTWPRGDLLSAGVAATW